MNIKLKLTNLNSDKIVRVKVSKYLVILKKLEVHIMLYPYILEKELVAAPLQNCSDFLKFYFKIHFKRAYQSLDIVVLVELSV